MSRIESGSNACDVEACDRHRPNLACMKACPITHFRPDDDFDRERFRAGTPAQLPLYKVPRQIVARRVLTHAVKQCRLVALVDAVIRRVGIGSDVEVCSIVRDGLEPVPAARPTEGEALAADGLRARAKHDVGVLVRALAWAAGRGVCVRLEDDERRVVVLSSSGSTGGRGDGGGLYGQRGQGECEGAGGLGCVMHGG
ncbi:uncharacterized protein B0I36DRAFT_335598 [Microdochium trichocladiopsis]|uniref:Uncharacterized protein n=1 Tax=Microdochium trichocladiopsis TaxID=1682393 RepID=A0A9P8XUB4_9PEZI|nr:uncharacterized protein B0I36DRAFT_335598 [Microdochium trichocladiopsis]KAH7018264.1 hypothetical protein B0I36DRAFT_335598 [Microdochium trichocladiopsis]